MSSKYFGSFQDRAGMIDSFFHDYPKNLPVPEDFPTEEEILFASYGGACYEGDARVVYEREGKLYEVHGSHCSCYGLEGQWSPEETSWAAINMRPRKGWESGLVDHEPEAMEAFWQLVDSRK